MAPRDLHHIAASDLDFFRVSLLVDDKLKDTINGVHLESLNPLQIWSNFSVPPTNGGPSSSFSALINNLIDSFFRGLAALSLLSSKNKAVEQEIYHFSTHVL
jgi:hypothetical protein